MTLTLASTLVGAITGVGGIALAFGGISSISIGKSSMAGLIQFLSFFSIGTAICVGLFTTYTTVNEFVTLAIGAGVGVGLASLGVALRAAIPRMLIGIAGGVIAIILVLLDSYDGVNMFDANQLARQQFAIAFLVIFFLLTSSSSKTTEMECHRFKYMLLSSMVGGYLLSDAVGRFGFAQDLPLSVMAFTILEMGGRTALEASADGTGQSLHFIVWIGAAFLGFLHQCAMRWGLFCYTASKNSSLARQFNNNDTAALADLVNGGPGMNMSMSGDPSATYENLATLPVGATLGAQHPVARHRLVCENCFATVPTGTAFCTECGEGMPDEGSSSVNDISISRAAMPSVTMGKHNVPERWQEVKHNSSLSSASLVDPKYPATNNNSLSMTNGVANNGRSIRFMESGVTTEKGKTLDYNDESIVRGNVSGVGGYDQQPSFRSFAASQYSIANRELQPVETPNIRKYKMSGSGFFHVIYIMSALVGAVWLFFLLTFYPQEHPCDPKAPKLPCDSLLPALVTSQFCVESKLNVDLNSNEGYCIQSSPTGVWIMYGLFTFSEFLNFFLGLLFNFSMWRPIRRGARFLNDFKPPLPKDQWPTVDIFLCHYLEPVTDSIATLKNCLALQYPPELLHIYILDDGYCKSVWDSDNHFKVSVNMDAIRQCGDLRGDIATLMHERVHGPVSDDSALKAWRRTHSHVRELRKSGDQGVARRDCAVGSLSDKYDYRSRGMPLVTFIGRMKPEVHHSKAGNINNALFNEGACGKYLLILDNDMKPHPKFLLAVIPFFFSEGEAVDGGGRQYSDDISWNQVSYVQTPQYFEETFQLTELGDPCGHKNTIFFDAVQCGRDGFESAAFAGTNAVFRRQAFDSIGGIQYGTQTEDAYTGNVLHTSGWDSVYFRKDFEGDPKDRIRLCEGAIPTTVAASMGQRKRWAKGAIQILMMKNESEVDPDWHPPRVPAPDVKEHLTFPRKMFFYDSVLYPFGSIPALCYITIAIYYLVTGDPPIYTQGLRLLYTFLPLMLTRWLLNLLANRSVDNNDVWRAQQTWFSYSFITMLAIGEALQARLTGKEKSWANTGAGQLTSWVEIPNVMFFFTLAFSQLVALIRFFQYESATAPWNYVASMFFGFWIMTNLFPMVKMSLTTYCGFDHTSTTFAANIVGSLILIYIVVFVQLWQAYYEENLFVALNGGQAV